MVKSLTLCGTVQFTSGCLILGSSKLVLKPITANHPCQFARKKIDLVPALGRRINKQTAATEPTPRRLTPPPPW